MKDRGRAFYRGSAGREKAEEELAAQKAKAEARKEQGNQPFRFKVKVGETTQFVVCDDEPEFYRFEHNLQDKATQRWNIFTGCTKEWENCPVCESSGRESYYALYLTVVDFTPFETRDGKTVEFSRKLLVVKPGQQKKFHRAYAKAQKDGLTLRGAVFEVTRDGDKDSSIGNDIEFVEFMEEDELTGYVRSWKDKEGKKHTENCSEVFDYEKLFTEPDSEALRALVGGSPTPGSRAHEEKELGRRPSPSRSRRGAVDADDADDDAADYAPASRKDRMPAGKPARRGRAEPEDDDPDDAPPPRRRGRAEPEDEPEDDDPPVRPARRGAREEAAPAKRRGRAEPEEEAPAPARRGGIANRPSSRARQEPEDDPEEDDPPPRRGAPGVGRRAGRG